MVQTIGFSFFTQNPTEKRTRMLRKEMIFYETSFYNMYVPTTSLMWVRSQDEKRRTRPACVPMRTQLAASPSSRWEKASAVIRPLIVVWQTWQSKGNKEI